LGVPLIPGRAAARPHRARRSGEQPIARPGDSTVAAGTPVVGTVGTVGVGVAVIAAAVLASATFVGLVPLPAASSIALLVPAALVDVEQRRVPDAWVVGALVVLLAGLVAESVIGPSTDLRATMSAAAGGALAMTFPVLVLHLVSPRSMGFGDVKAAGVLGAALGTVDWRLGLVALAIAAVAGAAAGIAGRQRTIAFGPFLVAGAWISLLAHEPILRALFTDGALL